MRAILSVSDKTGIEIFARELVSLGYEILSTGGTLAYLQKHHIKAGDIGKYTDSKELFAGRVKTLHPRIFGGILFRREIPSDVKSAEENAILPIDLVCVNLYPFKETTQSVSDFDEIVENIDIGGPSLIRAAAKNYKSVLVVVDKDDYTKVISSIKNHTNDIDFRKKLMIKAFSHTAEYDCFIANYMNERFYEGFGDSKFIVGKKYMDTKYGENPHQNGALYEFDSAWSGHFHILKGEGSFNNFLDINAATKIVHAFDKNAICIIKHGNPCGFAIKENAIESYKAALKCDSLSAYGGVLAINGTLDTILARLINETFFEAIVANKIDGDALEIFSNKKRVRLFELDNHTLDTFDFRHINGGFLFQNQDKVLDSEVLDSKQMGVEKASGRAKNDLLIAYKLAALTKSNCVTYVRDCALVGIGMGLTSRVDASKIAALKAEEMGLSLVGSSLASEAFFPFRDSIDLASDFGVKAIIEPGGSIRDNEVIEAANEHHIALYFSGKRHFLH